MAIHMLPTVVVEQQIMFVALRNMDSTVRFPVCCYNNYLLYISRGDGGSEIFQKLCCVRARSDLSKHRPLIILQKE